MTSPELYTEADVRSLPKGGELVLGAGVIATPAALDLAFERGIRVRWADGSRSPGSTHEKHDCLWHRILAADGSYFVKVTDGRARVYRLGDDGPESIGTDTLEAHCK